MIHPIVHPKILTNLAKLIRALCEPPMITVYLMAIFYMTGLLTALDQITVVLALLVVLPLASYLLADFIPQVRRRGPEGKRRIAFYVYPIGYILAVLYALLFSVKTITFKLLLTYLISAIFLVIFNKVLHIRASGHTCGTVGPYLMATFSLGLGYGFWLGIAVVIVIWASLYLGRHTVQEIIWGAVCSILGFLIAFVLL
ncbi:hypothetical protein [Oenococcus kitaharae]|uniref:Membrane-associated phospholipid phosphatase n=1 Tax=Oenococcus kitaharae DSM 17330 TaxID=1045004 RepID=G9WG81_9LACO|nr:hypothetical protein [Oenococcus kitaharae]EHN59689.1 hypothetical protein OKIT_1612 [Oenococcus kitaharae DSM 17330]OEY83523.1 hypothetical protein NT95_05265 [Oenococcus kitaharae]OEY85322.1 hypothetical protein NT96_01710 [Oenococcus kitaharae]OEY86176.1 hypothetical protein NV75_01660 [Oenococcus kitaharae]